MSSLARVFVAKFRWRPAESPRSACVKKREMTVNSREMTVNSREFILEPEIHLLVHFLWHEVCKSLCLYGD